VRRNGDNLNRPRWRRPNPYNNLRAGRGGRKRDAERCNQERLLDLHGSFSFEELTSYFSLRRELAGESCGKNDFLAGNFAAIAMAITPRGAVPDHETIG
jgi:hypothetical protein